MKNKFKKLVRYILIKLGIPLTKNIRYDILTGKILKRELKSDSNCIDVGAHKGEILEELIRLSPKGRHIAFEPIPDMYSSLQKKFGNVADIFPYALSDHSGETEFNVVLDDPAYSGLQKRTYKTESPTINKIKVEVKRLDDIEAVTSRKIALIKIDVEGGELDVLKGAVQLLERDKPLIIFECGKGASEYYGAGPELVYGRLNTLGYSLYTISSFFTEKSALTKDEFKHLYDHGKEYYFVAGIRQATHHG